MDNIRPDDGSSERIKAFVEFPELKSESDALSETTKQINSKLDLDIDISQLGQFPQQVDAPVEEGEDPDTQFKETPPTSPKEKRPILEEDIVRLNEERWPNVNGVYDAEGEWHDWNDITFSYSYENSELIILPYTVCVVSLPGQQYVNESATPATTPVTTPTPPVTTAAGN